ncbi:F-box/kelch-repeat protein At3g06240-like [Corylus avellana]|uniref:F-box/kelch-repeat protein At3g06240-like n=1 Tax=Corylus avellana TaxID=13451 RepID=UPI00286C37E6|nr:F-box/kelch-repeat protein At3g06240-like [Corylus avellana]XP_059433945.1 F-box/kelch-repeat protein At3g06240-like [Corylus avellana]
MSTYLPEELVLNILSRLPPKSLFRFRCVSKFWHTLIGNPDFFTSNSLNRSILGDPDRSAPLLLVTDEHSIDFPYKRIFYFLSGETLDCQSQIILKFNSLYEEFKIVASCNGLLCLHQHVHDKIYLWNPATSKALKALPPLRRAGLKIEFGVFLFTVGFGFDRRSNDFKVLRICYIFDNGDCEQQVEVYRLSTRRWRRLDLPDPFAEFYLCELESARPNFLTTVSDGVFFWWVMPAIHKEEIVAFDFGDELFRTTPLPDGVHFSDFTSVNFTVLNGCVAIVGFPHQRKRLRRETRTTQCLVIWVLFEFGAEESWTKLINLPLLLDYPERPLGFFRNRELFMQNAEGQLVLYDLLTHSKKDAPQIYGKSNRGKRLLRVFPLHEFDELGMDGARPP